MKRKLVVFDLETTGTDVAKDRIVSFAAVWRDENGDECNWYAIFDPGIPIPKEASDVHGITDEVVAGLPKFSDRAQYIASLFKDADVGGFNSNRFDVPLLAEELARCGIDFHDPNRKFYDAFVVFRKKHPRDLAAAFSKYCGGTLEGAHNALNDAEATLAIIEAQMSEHEDVVGDMDAAHEYCEFGDRVDFAGKLVMKDDMACYTFGKHAGKPVLLNSDTRSFADWMLRSDFPETTKSALRRILGHKSPTTLF